MANIPEYKKMYFVLKQKIKDKIYPVGSLIPTEPDLEKEFNVSRTTVRKVIAMLVSEGYIKVTQGKGTEVLDVSIVQKLNCISSITETLTAKGYLVSTQGMCIKKIIPPENVAEELKLAKDEMVYQVQRVQCADGVPIAIMTNYLKASIVPGLEKYSSEFVSLYALLEKEYHIIFTDSVERLSAVACDFIESQILNIEMGSPLLCSKRTSSLSSGLFEYSVIKLVADRYEYSIYMNGRR